MNIGLQFLDVLPGRAGFNKGAIMKRQILFMIKGQSVFRETHEHFSRDGKFFVNTP